MKFKVWPGRGNWMGDDKDMYFDVVAYPTQSKMLRRWKSLVPGDFKDYDGRDYTACVMPQTTTIFEGPHEYVSPRLGLVLFCLDRLNAGVIAHEAVHMATTYIRAQGRCLRLGKENCNKEERIAYAAGCCTNQIFNRLDGQW